MWSAGPPSQQGLWEEPLLPRDTDCASGGSGIEDGGVGAGHGGMVLVVELQQDVVVSLRGTGKQQL